MIVYKLNFTYFSRNDWRLVKVEIINTTLFGLIRVFLKETYDASMFGFNTKKAQKKVWNSNKKYINKIYMTFPVVIRK